MEKDHLKELIAIDTTYWWHIAKRDLLVFLLNTYCPPPKTIVEGGIGGAGTLCTLKNKGYAVSGFDIMPEAVEHAMSLGLDVIKHDITQPWPYRQRSVDAVIMQDVIEHLDDPVGVLHHARMLLAEKGCVFVTVPAYPSLMGPWDKMLGHKRRYSARLLLEQADNAGLKPVWLSHWNAFGLPAALLVRTLEKHCCSQRSTEFPKVSPAVNSTLIAIAKLERQLLKRFPLPIGLSLIGVFTPWT